MDDLLGDADVRIRVTGLPADAVDGPGPIRVGQSDGDWLTIAAVADDRVPDVVAAIVAAGGRVHAVEPGGRPSRTSSSASSARDAPAVIAT